MFKTVAENKNKTEQTPDQKIAQTCEWEDELPNSRGENRASWGPTVFSRMWSMTEDRLCPLRDHPQIRGHPTHLPAASTSKPSTGHKTASFWNKLPSFSPNGFFGVTFNELSRNDNWTGMTMKNARSSTFPVHPVHLLEPWFSAIIYEQGKVGGLWVADRQPLVVHGNPTSEKSWVEMCGSQDDAISCSRLKVSEWSVQYSSGKILLLPCATSSSRILFLSGEELSCQIDSLLRISLESANLHFIPQSLLSQKTYLDYIHKSPHQPGLRIPVPIPPSSPATC